MEDRLDRCVSFLYSFDNAEDARALLQEHLDSYDFEDHVAQEIVDYMWEMKGRLRELSLRTVLKIADLRKMSDHNWKRLAETTILKRAEV